MGGIILYTLPKSSLRDKLAAMIDDLLCIVAGKCVENVVFQLKCQSISGQRREMLNAFVSRHLWMRSDDVGGGCCFWLIDLTD